MQISLNWLKRYVDLNQNPQEISKALTSLGFEVESLSVRGEGLQNVVVGEVRACAKHPEADRLSVCKVFDGVEEVPVVCGAPNVAAGQKVLFARVGAELPGGLKIKKAKLRGQESFGMICAEDELGLGESHDGILVLDSATPVGISIQEVSGLCDANFEINVTPNRPDALGHLGVARELAARFGLALRYPNQALSEEGSSIQGLVSLALDDARCTRYVGRVVEGVTIGPSPDWLVKALASLGKKSINNVVDLTNFVLLEWGQPSHAFDLDTLAGKRIVVRTGRKGETLKTLDGVERQLDERDLVIADGDKPQVLAGVMGGEASGVSDTTKNVFLEVAYFNPRAVRAQSRRHGLSSDSSYRFERGVDPLTTVKVCNHLAALIARWCGGKIAKGRVEVVAPAHPAKPRVVSLRPSRVEKLLGVSPKAEEIEKLLAGIELKAASKNQDNLSFEIPGFRGDLEREADLIEEVARLMDYNAIPATLPAFPLKPAALPPGEDLALSTRHSLRVLGLSETISLRFTSRKALEKLNLAPSDTRMNCVPIRNPISEEWEVLPTTPLPGLLQALERNQNTQEPNVRLFEMGRAFFKRDRTGARDSGVREEPVLGIALMGEWKECAWSGAAGNVDFYRLKGLIENLFDRLRLDVRWQFGSKVGFLHPAESAELYASGSQEPVGVLGVLHPKAQAEYGLKHPVVVVELNLGSLLKSPPRPLQFQAYESHSGTVRDVNVVVAEKVRHAEILACLPAKVPHLAEVWLNSVYRGKGLPEGHKALHYSFLYRHPERSLTDEEANASHETIKAALLKNQDITIK